MRLLWTCSNSGNFGQRSDRVWFAIGHLHFVLEQRKERDNEDEEVYQLLSDAYIEFLRLVLEHPDLKLRTKDATPDLTEEQRERMQVLFEILISLFERAYLTAYSDDMSHAQQRRWHSWDDFMREWCRRDASIARCPACCMAKIQISPAIFAVSTASAEPKAQKAERASSHGCSFDCKPAILQTVLPGCRSVLKESP